INLPGPVGIAITHEDGAAITVDIAGMDPWLQRSVRVGSIDRTDESTLSESCFDTVRRHAWQDINRWCVEEPLDAFIGAVILEQSPDEMERGDAASPLGRVHVSIDDERRFFESCSGLAVRERQEPHRT